MHKNNSIKNVVCTLTLYERYDLKQCHFLCFVFSGSAKKDHSKSHSSSSSSKDKQKQHSSSSGSHSSKHSNHRTGATGKEGHEGSSSQKKEGNNHKDKVTGESVKNEIVNKERENASLHTEKESKQSVKKEVADKKDSVENDNVKERGNGGYCGKTERKCNGMHGQRGIG